MNLVHTKQMKIQKVNIKELLEDYTLDFSMFSNIDDRLLEIEDKWLSLEKSEKILIILYAEYKSYRKVGDILGMSHTTVARFINDVRSKLC